MTSRSNILNPETLNKYGEEMRQNKEVNGIEKQHQ